MAKKGRKHKGKRKGRKGKRKGRKGGTSFRGAIHYTPCRNSRGRFASKPQCKR